MFKYYKRDCIWLINTRITYLNSNNLDYVGGYFLLLDLTRVSIAERNKIK